MRYLQVLHSIVQGDFERPCLVHPEMPPELEAIVLRAMAKKPADRFPSVHALGVALFSYAEPAVRARWARAFDAGALEQATTRLTEVTVHPDSGQALATDPGKLVPQDLGAADVGERGWDEATRTRAKRPEGEDTQARESSLLREPVEPLAHTLARPEGVSSVELTQRGRPWAMAGALSLLALAATALGAALWLGSRPPVEVPVLEPEPVLSTRTASTTPVARPVPRAPPSAAAASGSVEAPPPALPRPAELPSTGPDRSEPLEPAAPERTRPRRPRPKGPIERGNNEAPILE